MSSVHPWLQLAAEKGASDIFIGARRCISFKIDGKIEKQGEPISVADAESMVRELFEAAKRPIEKFLETGDDDFPVTIPSAARFRVCTYRQRGSMAAIIRVVLFNLPNYRDINITDDVMSIASERNGLVLVTGAAGSGKTTTLACIINAINNSRNAHIITLEDPIEFLHKDIKCIVSQREVSTDTESYLTALRACMRQAPDIILLGEMRDHETIRTAMTAAETGHLVISTLHTTGVVNTVDRIIDVFPSNQQQQIRLQLSMVLHGVVSQHLLPSKNGGLIPAFEIMRPNTAIRNLIRESKIHQIDGVIQTSRADGMITMDTSLFDLFQAGHITKESAVFYASNPVAMSKRVGM
ncbi:MAG: PilT/PilU family type 4a pilus ATPase [Defluviitaleaceae bacterium]|nr:PilT/PilU family type 4a pilus ATPase [Defluviitaleaceae bacterium]MCL2837198.1 PilT/PilU family type 4a pilus ATPase [Defluviitaleaceae bacterium]